jgi:hypothetical protein
MSSGKNGKIRQFDNSTMEEWNDGRMEKSDNSAMWRLATADFFCALRSATQTLKVIYHENL